MPHIPTKKSLGQHFLYDTNILRLMSDAAHVKSGDTILEIGPGEGTLTRILGEKNAHIVAIEKDNRLISSLQSSFSEFTRIRIVEGDIMKLSADSAPLSGLIPGNYKIVANIPYYITGRFLKNFLEAHHKPSSVTIMVQREIAERIVTKDHKESILSLSVKVFGIPSIIRIVPRGAFSPPPKVDSAILHIDDVSNDWFDTSKVSLLDFFSTIKKAFGQKRKTLRASLGKNRNVPTQFASRRPETLTLDEWAILLNTEK